MTESIRDLQRKRRAAARVRADMQSLLAQPLDDVDEEESTAPAGPPPARVFVVFHGAKWGDPDTGLKESDSIAGVYATEDSARRAAAQLRKNEREREDAWYQPYPVQGA